MSDLLSILEVWRQRESEGSCQVLEFFGLPGSGKTYLSSMAYKKIRHDSISKLPIDIGKMHTLKRIVIKMFFALYLAAINFRVLLTIVKLIKEFHSKADRVFIKLFFNFLYIAGVVQFCKKHNRSLIADQGISQSIWSCAFHGNRKNFNYNNSAFFIMDIFSNIGLSDLSVIHVKANIDKVEARLRTREVKGNSPLNSGNKQMLKKGMDTTEKVRLFLGYISNRSNVLSIEDYENN